MLNKSLPQQINDVFISKVKAGDILDNDNISNLETIINSEKIDESKLKDLINPNEDQKTRTA